MELGLNLKKMWDEFSLKATISKTILITKIYNKLKKERYVECSASFLQKMCDRKTVKFVTYLSTVELKIGKCYNKPKVMLNSTDFQKTKGEKLYEKNFKKANWSNGTRSNDDSAESGNGCGN